MKFKWTKTKSRSAKIPENCIHEEERVNKKMLLEACFQKNQHFLLFVASVDRILGVEAEATLKKDSHMPLNKVAEDLLKDVLIR